MTLLTQCLGRVGLGYCERDKFRKSSNEAYNVWGKLLAQAMVEREHANGSIIDVKRRDETGMILGHGNKLCVGISVGKRRIEKVWTLL